MVHDYKFTSRLAMAWDSPRSQMIKLDFQTQRKNERKCLVLPLSPTPSLVDRVQHKVERKSSSRLLCGSLGFLCVK